MRVKYWNQIKTIKVNLLKTGYKEERPQSEPRSDSIDFAVDEIFDL